MLLTEIRTGSVGELPDASRRAHLRVDDPEGGAERSAIR
jgi:hypothetical protein